MSKHKHYKGRRLRYVTSCVLSILVVALMIAVPGCAEENPPPSPEPAIPSHFTTYTDEVGLFSIAYPSDWATGLAQLEEREEAVEDVVRSIDADAPVEGFSVIFLAGLPTEGGPGYPGVGIAVESLPVRTLDEAVEAEIQGLRELAQEYHVFSRLKATVGAKEATIVDYEVTLPGYPKLRALALVIVSGKVVWLVTCSTTSEEFSKCEDDFYAVVRSFRILK